jgi:hypothetical protein
MEVGMSISDIITVVLIGSAFALLGGGLAWASWQDFKAPRRKRHR